MRAARPTTGAAFTRLKVFDRALDSAAARCFLFGREDPTNPFVPRQRRQTPPSRLRRFRAERHAQVRRGFVHGTELARSALAHHFIRPIAAKRLALTSRTTPTGEVEGPPRSDQSSAAGAKYLPAPARVTTSRSRSPPTIVRRHVAPYRLCGGIVRRRPANFACAAASTGRCLMVVLAGSAPKKLFPFQLFKGRTGRATKPPPQLGHTFSKTSSTQVAQKVHS